jgi:dihydropteroate synthase
MLAALQVDNNPGYGEYNIRMIHEWHLRDRVFRIERRALVMGILNVTPDSFSDGGQFDDVARAIAHGLEMVRDGADLLDVGGESTRPGSLPVAAEEQIRRVLPVVRELRQQTDVPISVDTSSAAVARACLEAGADLLNDVTALRGDAETAAVVREFGAGVVLMHMRGTPATMQDNPVYQDVIAEVLGFLQERLQFTGDAGIAANRVVLDPGIGFGKTKTHNLELLARLGELQRLGRPVLLGVSRKGFLGGALGGRPPAERVAASLAAACHGLAHQAAHILRVHDVRATRDAAEVLAAILSVTNSPNPVGG